MRYLAYFAGCALREGGMNSTSLPPRRASLGRVGLTSVKGMKVKIACLLESETLTHGPREFIGRALSSLPVVSCTVVEAQAKWLVFGHTHIRNVLIWHCHYKLEEEHVCLQHCWAAWVQVGSRWVVGLPQGFSFAILNWGRKEWGLFLMMVCGVYSEWEETNTMKVNSMIWSGQSFGRSETSGVTGGRWTGGKRCSYQEEGFFQIPEELLRWREITYHWKQRAQEFNRPGCWIKWGKKKELRW